MPPTHPCSRAARCARVASPKAAQRGRGRPDLLALEATLGQVQGVYSGTEFWQVSVVAEPWAHRRWSPFLGIGAGKFKNVPNDSLVSDITTNVSMTNATVGLRYHLSERFVARIDYSFYTAYLSDTRAGEYRAYTAGLSFFF